MLRYRSVVMLASVIVSLVCIFNMGFAYAWEHTMSSQVSLEYESNPAMTTTSSAGVWRGIFEPNYAVLGRYGQDEIKSGISVLFARSSNEILRANRSSPSMFLDWLRQTESAEFGMSSRYAEASTRDAVFDGTGQVPVNSMRASRIISGRISKAFSVRSTLSGDAAYEGVSYQGGNFVDYATRTENMTYSYVWSETNAPYLQLTHTDYLPNDGITLTTFTNTVTLGTNSRFSDAIDGNVHVGRSKVGNADFSIQGGGSIQYSGLRDRLVLNVNRQVTPSGLGGFITSDQIIGSWNYALSEASNIGVDLGWQSSRFVAATMNTNAGVWQQQRINSAWGTRTYYRRNTVSGELIETVFSNTLGINFSYTNTDF